jgi:hypothetical protein
VAFSVRKGHGALVALLQYPYARKGPVFLRKKTGGACFRSAAIRRTARADSGFPLFLLRRRDRLLAMLKNHYETKIFEKGFLGSTRPGRVS